MEVQEIMDRWGPWPWLLFQHEADSIMKIVLSLSYDDEPHVSVPELENKSVQNCCHGWLILSIGEIYYTKFSLWNPVSLESINLPPLASSHGLGINACILSSDPSSLDSTVFLFNRGMKGILYCRIHGDDRRWIWQCYEKEIFDINLGKFGSDDSLPKRNINDDHLHTPVICNGKLYCLTYNGLILVRIEVLEKENGIVLLIQPLIQLPCPLVSRPGRNKQQLIESGGDIFTVSIAFEHRDKSAKFGNEVLGVEVHKLNLSAMAWERTMSVGDLAFFSCDGDIAFSCSAKILGIRGNHLYFTRKQDFRLYSYDIEEGMLSIRLPCPNTLTPWESLLWIMPHLRSTNSFGQALSIYEKEEVNQEKEVLEAGEKESNISNPISSLAELPLDILKDISQRLDFFAYKIFGTLSTNCRRASSPSEINSFVSPWLLYFQKNKGIFNIIGPKGSDRYLVQVPESLRDATICYCKDSWLLMCKYTGAQAHQLSVNFVNPFNKNVIQYPDLSLKHFSWSKFSFSCSPTSSSCLVIVLPFLGTGCLKVCSSREEGWKKFKLGGYFCYPESFCTNQIFAYGKFYFMTQYRELGVFRLEGDMWHFSLRQSERSHLSHYQSFLAEHNGELISCFVNDMGKCLVFKLKSSTRLWEEITSLGKYTMYVSRMSSFLTIAKTPEMEDKIYLPKFHENGAMVSLCLKTGKYSFGSSEGSFNDWNGSREQLWACWIRPN